MNTFKSRFGFHPTSHETYMKLKELHKWYWKTLYAFHRWNRWDRKQPQNRRGPEPSYCPLFVLDKSWYRITTGQDGNMKGKYFPKTVTDHGIVDLYHMARMPQAEPMEVFSNETLAKINKLYSDFKDWQREKVKVA